MGLFDGAGGTDWASTAHVARLLNCPVILVVDCARLSRPLAAIVHGYQTLDDRIHIAGVVLNRVGSDRHLAMLKAAIAPLRLPVLGVLRRDDAVTLPDRHLGLVPTDELSDLPERFRHLATLGQRCFDWQALEKIWQPATDSPTTTIVETSQSHHPQRSSTRKIRIGIARDRAFNFYYADNLEILTRLGAELVPFSPLTDDALPPDLSGLWLGGGFPEMFAAELSHNQPLRAAIAQQTMPLEDEQAFAPSKVISKRLLWQILQPLYPANITTPLVTADETPVRRRHLSRSLYPILNVRFAR